MKVLIFNSLYYPNIVGGAERSVQLLAENLQRRKVIPVVVSTSNKDYIDYINGVKVYYVKVPNLYWMKEAKEKSKWKKPLWHLIDTYNPFIKRKILKILRDEKPDIVHTNNLAGFSVKVWELAKIFRIPVVHTIRDYYLLCPSSTMFKNEKNCDKQCIKCKFFSMPKKFLSNKYVDAAVGVSKFIINRHFDMGYFRNAKVKTYIYNPISSSNFPCRNKSNGKETIFGLVGRISSSKGTELALDYFNRLNLPNAKLFVYGRGETQEYENKLKKRYSSSKIVFKGFKKPEEIYQELDVSIIPSLWNEPFSRILIESYAYGIPVLASSRGGIPENVIEGKTGYLFEPTDRESFEAKLKKLLKTHFDKEFIRNFASNFSVDKHVDLYCEMYNQLKID